MRKKNLIIGFIKGYKYEKISLFMNSLKATDFDGDLCLVSTDISKETINEIQENRGIVFPVSYRGGGLNSWSRFWKYIRPFEPVLPNFALKIIMKKILPLLTVRFMHYGSFLKKNRNKYEHVLITDIRDVIFQKNPFQKTKYDKIQCYEEYLTMGKETLFNVPWIEALYGKGKTDSFATRKIICAGTILGPIESIIEFLDDYARFVYKAKDISIGGSDQGIYNFMIRTKYSNKVDFIPYGDGEILTISNSDTKIYKIIDNKICNLKGEIIPVVHQFDRIPELNSLVLNRMSFQPSTISN